MSHGTAHRKTTIWLGNDDGQQGGYGCYGFDVRSEDNMVAVEAPLEDRREMKLLKKAYG